MKGTVHFDYAISLGLGEVKIVEGEHVGDYLLYNFDSIVDDEANPKESIMEEILKLKLYVQLANPTKVDDKKLEKLLIHNPMYLSTLILGNPARNASNLASMFNNKKGKVLEFANNKC